MLGGEDVESWCVWVELECPVGGKEDEVKSNGRMGRGGTLR